MTAAAAGEHFHRSPFSRELSRIMTAAGHGPILLPTVGGRLLIDLSSRQDIPVITFPIVNHDHTQGKLDCYPWSPLDIYFTTFFLLTYFSTLSNTSLHECNQN